MFGNRKEIIQLQPTWFGHGSGISITMYAFLTNPIGIALISKPDFAT